MTLNISTNLTLPDEAVTQTFGILAKRGVGKTYTASVMTEEMLKNNLHVVVIDPIGVWYGLRSSADGKGEGLSIIIAGGEHSDIPIKPESGEIVANLIIDNRLSMVIDISLFRKGEQTKFMTAFAETMYRRNRNAIHLVVDEADAFAPQRPQKGQERMLGAMEDLVRRGRARGIGMTMITQRPAVLNKNVLTQIEVLVALRLTAPIDQKAIDEWVKSNAEEGQREEFMNSISSLPIGEAYFWSPGWLKIFKRVKVRTRETLDSSSTPIAGREVVMPKKMASVNLESLREQLSVVEEEIESNDPKALKAEIKKLKQQLSDQKPEVITKTIEIPSISVQQMATLHKNIPPVMKILQELYDISADAEARPLTMNRPEIPVKQHEVTNPGNEVLSKYAESLLKTFRERWPMKMNKVQLSLLSGKRHRSSAFMPALNELLNSMMIERVGNDYQLTGLGSLDLKKSESFNPHELFEIWRKSLPPYEESLFSELIRQPSGMNREELAIASGKSIKSSAFPNAISTLKKNNLVTIDGDLIKVHEMFV